MRRILEPYRYLGWRFPALVLAFEAVALLLAWGWERLS